MKTVKEFCKQHGITEDQFSGKEKIEGGLDLRSLTSIPEGFNPTVGGYLDLRSLTSIPEGFNPTVGGYLYLRSLTSIPEGFNPTVGGYLYLGSGIKYIGATVPPVKVNRNFIWEKYGKKFGLFDGVFCEIIGKRGFELKGEFCNVYKCKKINRPDEFFVVNKGEFYAHAKEMEAAFSELDFKIASEKLKNDPITPETLLTVLHYRVITGACDFGCREFMDKHKIAYTIEGDKAKEASPMKAKDLLVLLEKSGAYGLDKFKRLIQI